mgnify:CR=1 FL=1
MIVIAIMAGGSDEVQDSSSARLATSRLVSPWVSRWTRVDMQVIGLWYRILIFPFAIMLFAHTGREGRV